MAEDSEDAVLLLNRLLRKCGAAAERVSTGAAAIDWLQARLAPGASQFLPHAEFLDIQMPLYSGFGVLEWIRQQQGLDATAVVTLSSSNRNTEIERAR